MTRAIVRPRILQPEIDAGIVMSATETSQRTGDRTVDDIDVPPVELVVAWPDIGAPAASTRMPGIWSTGTVDGVEHLLCASSLEACRHSFIGG